MRMIVSGLLKSLFRMLKFTFGLVFLIAAICVGSTPD